MPIFNASEIKKHRLVQLNEGEDVLRIKTDSASGVRKVTLDNGLEAAISMLLPASILSGPVAVTGVTTEQLLHSFVIPKEVHSTTSRLIFSCIASMTNNANSKTLRVRVGDSIASSVVIGLSAPVGVAQLAVPGLRLKNRGAKNVQVSGYSLALNAGTSGTAPATFAIDFTVDQTVFVTAQLGTASDTMTLEDFDMAFGA